MLKAYQEGKDVYCEIASIAFGVPYEDCKEFRPDGTKNPEGKERRSSAKSVVLGELMPLHIERCVENQVNPITRGCSV